MAVLMEQIGPDKFARNDINLRLRGLRRGAAGQWYADIEAEGEVALRDGRVIDMRRNIAARMNQQRGRRGGRNNPT